PGSADPRRRRVGRQRPHRARHSGAPPGGQRQGSVRAGTDGSPSGAAVVGGLRADRTSGRRRDRRRRDRPRRVQDRHEARGRRSAPAVRPGPVPRGDDGRPGPRRRDLVLGPPSTRPGGHRRTATCEHSRRDRGRASGVHLTEAAAGGRRPSMHRVPAGRPLPAGRRGERPSGRALPRERGPGVRVVNTLYVTEHQARVGLQKGNLVVVHDQQKTRVPIETLEGVVLLGGSQISSQALGRCVERGARVCALSRSGRLRWTVGGPTKGSVLRRMAQLRAADDPARTARVARWIVAGKLQNCRRMISRWLWDADSAARWVLASERDANADRLQALAQATDGHTIRGIEGDGTRRYFKCLGTHLTEAGAELGFTSRTRRPPRNEVNALLSFYYGLVLAEAVGALDAVGLDPQ